MVPTALRMVPPTLAPVTSAYSMGSSMCPTMAALLTSVPSGSVVVKSISISFQVPIWMTEGLAMSKLTTVRALGAVSLVDSSVFSDVAV